MSITVRVWLSLTLGLVLLLPASGEEKKAEAAKVGNELLFMVADFAPGGPFKGHCGCPSAMIGNHDAKAIVIWSKTADAATLKLAQAANEHLGVSQKTQGYLILFDVQDAEFAATAEKSAFKKLTLGNARRSAEQVFQQAEVDAEATQVVMLVNDKIVSAVWQLKANDLTPEKSRDILDAAETFLR